MMNDKSISSILEESLDLIEADLPHRSSANDDGNSKSHSLAPGSSDHTASSVLLNHIRSANRSLETEDFISFNPSKQPPKATPLLDQISTFSVDEPKYWNNNGSASANKKGGNSFVSKRKVAKRAKGEQYGDKLTAKMHNKSLKKKNKLMMKKS